MRKLWILALVGALAITLGCGVGGGGGAEGAAKNILEGVKKGDASALLEHLDLKSMYEELPEMAREQMTYEEFEKMTREAMETAAGEEDPPEGFEYKILSSEVKDDATIVKIQVKEDKDAEWKDYDVPFKKIDGKWKVSAKDLMALSGD